jgi:hypothetical protein
MRLSTQDSIDWITNTPPSGYFNGCAKVKWITRYETKPHMVLGSLVV